MAKQQTFTEQGCDDTTKQPTSLATHPTTAKVMKGGSEAIELKLRKIEKIDANSYKCDNVESALAPAKNGGI